MIITIKTLKQEVFKVDVDENDKVLAIKAEIEKTQGHPISNQKLIFSGKILVDENTISEYNIKEKDFLVIMVSKPKAATPASSSKSAAAASSSTPTTESPASSAPSVPPAPLAPVTQTSVEEAPAAEVSASPVVGENPTPAAATEPTAAGTPDSALVTGAGFETAIQNMMELGFPREQCMLAMRASFNNPDRAAEYLMNGIPEHLLAQAGAPAPGRAPSATAATGAAAAGAVAAGAAAPSSAPAPASANRSGAAPTGAAAQPQNLFTAAAQAAANARRGGDGASGTENDLLSLLSLRDQPQFQQIRDLVQNNPDLLQPLLLQLGQSNPQMLQLINRNQEAFLQLLNEGIEDQEGGHPAPPPGVSHVYVTREEQEAIDRLVGLGFTRNSVVEAFLACDRDEELAANFLFEHGFEDNDEDSQ
ncbi:hypothetical protein B0O80DRAFT_451177 [Mortierella sp. GBAus27b]|nr:hypothetical protein B0O80DRAFT_451177 [Mortierella sp. GBAus27b]